MKLKAISEVAQKFIISLYQHGTKTKINLAQGGRWFCSEKEAKAAGCEFQNNDCTECALSIEAFFVKVSD